MRAIIVLAISLLLTACASMGIESSESRMKRLLEPSIGKSISDVIMTVGVPTNKMDIDDDLSAYTWAYQSTGSTTSFRPDYLTGGVRAVSNDNVNSCNITLFVNKNTKMVERYRWEGNNC